jgi:hypothetical protein
MAVSLTHSTVAVGEDAGNGEIRKAQWNEGHTLTMATARLLGRTSSGAGAVEEISVGSGLSLSAGSLSADGGGAGSWTEISRATASDTATVDFTGLSSAYDEYKVVVYRVVPATNETVLAMRTSANGGTTFDSGGSDYTYVGRVSAFTSSIQSFEFGEENEEFLIDSWGASSTASNGGVSGEIVIPQPATSARLVIRWQSTTRNSSPDETAFTIGGGSRNSTSAVNAIRLFFRSGNIASGLFVLLGRRK